MYRSRRGILNASVDHRPGARTGRSTAAHPSALVYSAPIGALSPTLDATFFALSDPTRRGILERLGGGPATISELATPFGLTINGIKKHVGILEGADLVVTAKVGRARECRLGPASLAEATEWIADYRRAWEGRLDRFGRYVERTAGGDA
jgi:DNA-binding transcriptional ArsR family regulator